MPGSRAVLRPMRLHDVPAVLAIQEPAAVAGLSEVFPQDRYPFPHARGRRFWEKHGWQPTGETLRGSFQPYAELICYELAPGVVTATEGPPVPG